MTSTLAWGILGTGAIARTFAAAVPRSRTGRLAAVGSRQQATASAFGERFGIKRCHDSYEALLADPHVEAVYIATPHPMHAPWAIAAAQAGKHVLCEKPLTVHHAQAVEVIEAVRKHDVFLMEAFMYRCHPQTARLVELVRSGAIGQVRVIQATFSYGGQFDPQSAILSPALAGGGILDVGCYCTSMARLIAGAAHGQDFAEPEELKAVGRLGPTGVDEWTAAVLRFPGDIVAELATGVQVQRDNAVRIFGSAGWIEVPEPWVPAKEGGKTSIYLHAAGDQGPAREIVINTPLPLYTLEADTVADYLDRRQAAAPAMTWQDTLGNMKTLDRWREQIGLRYER